MKNLVLAIAVTTGLMFACTSAPKEKETVPVTTPGPAPAEEHHHDAAEAIELNNGAKWQVNPEMMQYIKIMETDINNFNSSSADLPAYEQLGKSLQKNIDLLTSSCTMKGKAHDELHKWLLPYIEKVDGLNKAKTTAEASSVFEKVKASFGTFHQYFE